MGLADPRKTLPVNGLTQVMSASAGAYAIAVN
jgi:hypothetical protein